MHRILFTIILLFSSNLLAQHISEHAILPIPEVIIEEPELVQLGKQLFHDVRFSSTGEVSCASCHNLATGGVDRMTTSIGVNGMIGGVNAPTVFNSSLNFRQFWDGRALTLFEQVAGPLHNPKEMASGWEHVVKVLQKDEFYRKKFTQLFDDGITAENFTLAIVRFEESLLTPNSRFDLFLKGDDNALTEYELHGYELFRDYGCISCHQGVGIGGNTFQKLGVMEPLFEGDDIQPSDLGRYNITGKEADKFEFKVPSLRNVDLTAPYLHNGSAKTLEKVVEIMMTHQLGMTGSKQDIEAIVAFLKTLTGEYNGKPL